VDNHDMIAQGENRWQLYVSNGPPPSAARPAATGYCAAPALISSRTRQRALTQRTLYSLLQLIEKERRIKCKLKE
jgi:hypothetical protein